MNKVKPKTKRFYKKGYKPGKVNNTVIDKRVHNGIMGAFKRLEAKLARLKVRN